MQQTLEMVQLLAKLTIEYIEVISIKFKQLCNACKPNTLVKNRKSTSQYRTRQLTFKSRKYIRNTFKSNNNINFSSKSDFMNLLKCIKKSKFIYHFRTVLQFNSVFNSHWILIPISLLHRIFLLLSISIILILNSSE